MVDTIVILQDVLSHFFKFCNSKIKKNYNKNPPKLAILYHPHSVHNLLKLKTTFYDFPELDLMIL